MKIKIWASTGYVGCVSSQTIEIPDEEWNEMTEDEREEYCLDIASNLFEWGFYEEK